MTVAALLAAGSEGADKVAPLDPEAVGWLERRIDAMQAVVPEIARFHVCRTVCRRAERAALRADAKYGADAGSLAYLNRLSDYFYLLGRLLTLHYGVEETLWEP